MNVDAVSRDEYLEVLTWSARRALPAWRGELERWSQGTGFSKLWGYNVPGEPLRLAGVLAYLRSVGGMGREASREALAIVRAYAAVRDGVDRGLVAARAETREAGGLPLFVNFFFVTLYAETVGRLRATGDLDAGDVAFLERELAVAVNLVFSFPEWGGHNRAIIRADGLSAAAAVMPVHPDAARWRRMADVLASDSTEHWEIEDASIYQPVWLYYLLRWQERAGDAEGFRSPFLRWYAEFFLQMTAPHGTIPDYGDGEWRGTWLLMTACLERAARATGDRRLRWAAARTFRSCRHLLGPAESAVPPKTTGMPAVPWELADAHRWCAEWNESRCPDDPSREVLDDAIGRKIVFRSGWEATDSWMVLSYMDEGSWGWLDRQYLRDTLTVGEEKMHHGHSDENGVAMLMSGGSLLLHDAGYRDDLPSGRFGAFRADYFHNRLVCRPYRLDRGQDLFELLRNSGAYRPVRSHKIDFQRLRHVDYSRTRLVDERTGWQWDRIVAFLRGRGEFVVVDGWCALADGCFTTASLWHTQAVVARGDGWMVGGYDLLPSRSASEQPEPLPRDRRLLVRFGPRPQGRTEGAFPISRHYGPETAFYQADSAHFLAGRWSAFVTRLVPVPGDASPSEWQALAGTERIVPTDWDGAAVCVEVSAGGVVDLLFVKLDLERERRSSDTRPRIPFEAGAVTAGPLRTDAHFAHVRTTVSGAPSWSATVVSGLAWQGGTLFQPPANTFGLQPDGAPDRESRARWRSWESEE